MARRQYDFRNQGRWRRRWLHLGYRRFLVALTQQHEEICHQENKPNGRADFDHGDAISTWPNTIAPIKAMKGISDADKEKILGGNAMRLFGMTS